MEDRKIRILVAKPGLDGHDRGAKVIAAAFRDRLLDAYASIRVGDPADESTLMGPLISESAVTTAERAVAEAQRRGARVLAGGKRIDRPGYYFEPTLIAAPPRKKLSTI